MFDMLTFFFMKYFQQTLQKTAASSPAPCSTSAIRQRSVRGLAREETSGVTHFSIINFSSLEAKLWPRCPLKGMK